MDAILRLLVQQIQDALLNSTTTHGTTLGVSDVFVILDDQRYTDETINTVAKIAKLSSPHDHIFYMGPLACWLMLGTCTFALHLKKDYSDGTEKTD